jgi:hypothetical protein
MIIHTGSVYISWPMLAKFCAGDLHGNLLQASEVRENWHIGRRFT